LPQINQVIKKISAAVDIFAAKRDKLLKKDRGTPASITNAYASQ